ncbi:MAG: Mth938-like domain-containing protein [Gammaproteobacteria bacterium]|nr:Mth938-like domain-containing protein [Gammaproteobacteria bacterium]
MNFSQDTDESGTQIHSYTDDYFVINQSKYDNHSQIHHSGFVQPWLPGKISQLSLDDFKALLSFKPDVIILGTGNKLKFPNNELRRELSRLNIGLEVMDTGAACRTYNILLSEGRNVAAAILLLKTEV